MSYDAYDVVYGVLEDLGVEVVEHTDEETDWPATADKLNIRLQYLLECQRIVEAARKEVYIEEKEHKRCATS